MPVFYEYSTKTDHKRSASQDRKASQQNNGGHLTYKIRDIPNSEIFGETIKSNLTTKLD